MQRLTHRTLVTALLLTAACEGKTPRPPARPTAAAPAPAPVSVQAPVIEPLPATPPPPPITIGMEDPFARMKPATLSQLYAGWKAVRHKQPAEARAAFHAVVLANPDNTAVRFEELKAAVAAGDHAAVPGLWTELLARDFVTYANRLDKSKEMAPLRSSSEWTKLVDIKAAMKAAYAKDLDKGFLFVARARPHDSPEFEDTDAAAIDLEQEVYHFDPSSKRIRRLTETGGHVIAMHREGGKLIVLTAKTLKKTDDTPAFSKPEATVLSLDTLDKTVPLTVDADAVSVQMCFSEKGEPILDVDAGRSALVLTVDGTGTSLVPVQEECSPTLATTTVEPRQISYSRPAPEGVALSDDGLQLTGIDADKPVRSASSIRAGALLWSPGKKRFSYTGDVDRCDKVDKGTPASNALFVWDSTKKKSARLVSSPAAYEMQWLDDDHLAYETRTPGSAKLVIHDFSGGPALTVKAPAGIGLYGMPTLPCTDSQVAMVE
jgi:hypothetical protein